MFSDQDEKKDCFLLCVGAHFTGKDDVEINRQWIKDHKVDVTGLKFPMKVNDIHKFERLNQSKLNCAINVLAVEEGCVFPLFRSKMEKASAHINLILTKVLFCPPSKQFDEDVDWSPSRRGKRGKKRKKLSQIEVNRAKKKFISKAVLHGKEVGSEFIVGEFENHYVLCRDLTSLLKGKKNGSVVFCSNCLTSFYSKNKLLEHERMCFVNATQRMCLPEAGTEICFKHFEKKIRCSITGYYDCESLMRDPKSKCKVSTCKGEEECTHLTTIEKEQIPFLFSLVFLNFQKEIIIQKTFCNESNCGEQFFDYLLSVEPFLLSIVNAKLEMDPLTDEEEAEYEGATTCHLCEEPFLPSSHIGDRKVRDHSHSSGRSVK